MALSSGTLSWAARQVTATSETPGVNRFASQYWIFGTVMSFLGFLQLAPTIGQLIAIPSALLALVNAVLKAKKIYRDEFSPKAKALRRRKELVNELRVCEGELKYLTGAARVPAEERMRRMKLELEELVSSEIHND